MLEKPNVDEDYHKIEKKYIGRTMVRTLISEQLLCTSRPWWHLVTQLLFLL